MRNSAGHAELAMLYLDSRDAGITPSEMSADSREHLPRSGRMKVIAAERKTLRFVMGWAVVRRHGTR